MSNYVSIYTGEEIDEFLTAAKNLVNFTGTPTAETINITANVPYTVKNSSGWIIAFGAGSNTYTEIRNDATMVWQGDYIQNAPFYLDTSIKIFCTENNTISIVYA